MRLSEAPQLIYNGAILLRTTRISLCELVAHISRHSLTLFVGAD